MICITDCATCKNSRDNIDGWIDCCRAYPKGIPFDFNYNNLIERKICNPENEIGYEPKDD